MSSDPRIIWPAPGLPVLLDGGVRQVPLLIAQTGSTLESLSDWLGGLGLADHRDHRRIGLDLEHIEPVARGEVGACARGFAALPEAQRLHFFRVALHARDGLEPAAPRSAQVFDLVRAGIRVRGNAVGVMAPGTECLRLAFASDLHVAAIWDVLADAVERHAPDLTPRFLHPQCMLVRFIDEANALAARGELDLVVFGGDLVDHVYQEPRSPTGQAPGRTNLSLFLERLARLEVPAVALPGNHDYRLFPWRPRLPELAVVGIPAARVRALLGAAGLWDWWPLRWSDRDVLRTQDADGRSALARHLTEIAPATDMHVDVRGTRLIFASTGRDVVPRWREVEWRRRPLLARSLLRSQEDPDCEGLHQEQITHIAAALAAAHGAAVFLHAPLLHPPPHLRVEERLDRLDPGDDDTAKSHIAFERKLFATGLRNGVLFRNVGPLLRALTSAPGPTAVISGHVHRATAVALDRRTLHVRTAPFAAPAEAAETIPLATAPSLAHLRPGSPESPGYLLARFERGSMVALERRALTASQH